MFHEVFRMNSYRSLANFVNETWANFKKCLYNQIILEEIWKILKMKNIVKLTKYMYGYTCMQLKYISI